MFDFNDKDVEELNSNTYRFHSKNENSPKLVNTLRFLARFEYPRAQFYRGYNYETESEKYGLALKWYNRAIAQDDAKALKHMAHHYEEGRHIQRNESKALDYFVRAANKGCSASLGWAAKMRHTESQYKRGMQSHNAGNKDSATYWLGIAAKYGHKKAAAVLKEFY